MKVIYKDLLLGIIADIICNGIPFLIFKLKGENTMATIFIISAVIFLSIIWLFLSLYEKLGKYNHAVNIQLFAHLSIIRNIFETHPEIAEKYQRDVDGMAKLNPLKLETLDDLFIFNKNDNYKESIKNLNPTIYEKK
jgi:hypothetical protein